MSAALSCIDKLSHAQTSVVSYVVKLNRAIDASHNDLVLALVNRLCDELIKYVSIAHYRVLRNRNVAAHHLVAIERITRDVVAFNDRYGMAQEIDVAALKLDLEILALALETRFEIEDEVSSQAFA